MTSRERIIATLEGKIPDRVPAAEMFIDPSVIQEICPGMSYEDFVDYADIDMVTCLTMAEPAESIQWVDKSQKLWRDKWGALQKLTDEVISVIMPPAKITSEADLASYQPPDPSQSPVIPQARKLVSRFKGERAIAVVGEAGFAPAQYLLGGLEAFCIAMFDQPDLVNKLVRIGVEYHVELYRKLLSEGVDIIILGDDYAFKSGPLISPTHFEQFILPGLTTVVKESKAAGGYVIKHSDGDIWKLLDMLVSTGIDMLGPLEPAYMPLDKVREATGGRVGVMGNVDVDLLSRGSKKQVRDATIDLLRSVSPGGGHMVSSGNSIPSSVKGENLMAMVKAAHEYGKYPISI